MEFTPEQLAEIQKKIDAAVNSAVDGLKNKRDELLGKLDKAKTDLKAIEDGKKADLEALEQAKLLEAGKHTELIQRLRDSHEEIVKTLREDLLKAQTDATKATSSLRVLIVDNDINKRLLEAGVTDPILLEAAAAMIIPSAEISEDAEGNSAVKIAGTTLDDFFTTWKETKGKAFIANGNSGGGSGDEGGGGGTDDWETFFKKGSENQSKQAELQRVDPTRYDTLRKKYPLDMGAGGGVR